jgi:hypothetical protein
MWKKYRFVVCPQFGRAMHCNGTGLFKLCPFGEKLDAGPLTRAVIYSPDQSSHSVEEFEQKEKKNEQKEKKNEQ